MSVNSLKITELGRVDSTIKYAHKIIDSIQEANSGNNAFAISADEQTQGITTKKNDTWHSKRGGLYCTCVILDQDIPINQTIIPILFGLFISEEIRDLVDKKDNISTKVEIKWPNDIMINGKKACGIICEKYKNYFVISFGINISNLTDELKLQFSQLSDFMDKKKFLNLSKSSIINSIYKRYLLSMRNSEKNFIDEFRDIQENLYCKDEKFILQNGIMKIVKNSINEAESANVYCIESINTTNGSLNFKSTSSKLTHTTLSGQSVLYS